MNVNLAFRFPTRYNESDFTAFEVIDGSYVEMWPTWEDALADAAICWKADEFSGTVEVWGRSSVLGRQRVHLFTATVDK